jgi:GPH family glycoside/pentoside/hexuronide:cation symporter
MTTSTPGQSRLDDRIHWNQLIAYGMGGLIPIAIFNIAGQLMGLLGNISLGLSAFWLGTIMIIPRLWDAVSDPIVGHLSDNTRTSWGRRRPFIFVGAIAVAVSFVAMWWVPRGDAVEAWFSSEEAYNWFQLLFILGGLLVFFTACTIFEIPHGALGMEMSSDYHERTKLFSAKSFLGNLFAMGTPWLIALAGMEFFKGPAGDLIDGMRYVSLMIAAVLIPMAFWWLFTLKEPGFRVAKEQKKTAFWSDMRTTLSNGVFLQLVVVIFTLAMGFNFVALFNYYITIFYLFGGDEVSAGTLLGINGTAWAITGLVAVFPLNWISRRIGKSRTLLIAILLMCAAQLSKIICYDPEHPYLVLIPTILLSAGMLMFFTLGASMVGDICDADELKTGTRSEGSYYSVFWWFIKMGTAFASFVTGTLLIYTQFDEKQNVSVDDLRGSLTMIQTMIEDWEQDPVEPAARLELFDEQIETTTEKLTKLQTHLEARANSHQLTAEHSQDLALQLSQFAQHLDALAAQREALVSAPDELSEQLDRVLEQIAPLKRQAPDTLLRLRVVEIGLPLLLSIVSILLTLNYPLTEARCYEIKEALRQRRVSAEMADSNEE